MNAVQKAIQEIKFRIPIELLHEAFIVRPFDMVLGPQVRRRVPITVDYLIRQHVIEERVIPDTNLVGGMEINIPIIGAVQTIVDPYNTIYTIPKRITQNRVISRVQSISIGGSPVGGNMGAGGVGVGNMGVSGASPMMGAVGGVFASAMPVPIVSTANIQMIGENTVMINDNWMLPNNSWLLCVVEADSEFSQLSPPYWLDFCKLCEFAVKAYIYNKLVIEVGMAHLSGGMELGKFKEILDTYSDANENYGTFLEGTWKVSYMQSDPSQKFRALRMLFGGTN